MNMQEQPNGADNKRADKTDIVADAPATWDACRVNPVNPYGQEEDFAWRVMEFTRDLVAACADATVLVVCHYEWIRKWFALYKKMEVSPANCQLMVATI